MERETVDEAKPLLCIRINTGSTMGVREAQQVSSSSLQALIRSTQYTRLSSFNQSLSFNLRASKNWPFTLGGPNF